jgi:hypothetical protein
MTEIRASEKQVNKVIKKGDQMVRRFVGGDAELPTPENVPYEYIGLLLPQIAYTNPRVEVLSRNSAAPKPVIQAQKHGLNRWVNDTQFAKKIRHSLLDSFFSFGVTMTTLEDMPGYGGTEEWVPVRPAIEHIPPHRFRIDPLCMTPDRARWMGHMMVADHEDLMDLAEEGDNGWNQDALEALKAGTDVELARPKIQGMEDLDRQEVTYYCIWVPEKTLSKDELPDWWEGDEPTPADGFHGTLYTVCDIAGDLEKDTWIRDPYPYYGPPWGPYAIYGVHDRPNSGRTAAPLPLAPLTAGAYSVDNLNNVSEVMTQAIRRHKNVAITKSKDLADKLKHIKDGEIGADPTFDKEDLTELELGGVTDQMVNHHALMKDRSDRNLSMSDAARGSTKAHVTATGDAIAADNRSARFAWFKLRIYECCEQNLKTVSWYLWHTESVVFPLGESAADELQMEDPWYYGGTDEEDGMTWYDLELQIEPFSMEKTNEALQAQRAMQVLELVANLAPIIPQTPYVGWSEILDMVGESINRRGLGDLIDARTAAAAAQQAAAAAGAEEGTPVSDQPGVSSPSQAGANQVMQANQIQ